MRFERAEVHLALNLGLEVGVLLLLLCAKAAVHVSATGGTKHFRPDQLHGCHSQAGPSSLTHEAYLNRLDGKRVVFIGDSVTRCVLLLASVCRNL